MNRSLNVRPVSRHSAVRMVSLCNAIQNPVQRIYSLHFSFFAYFFSYAFAHLPICRNCS